MNKYGRRVRTWLGERGPDIVAIQKIGRNEEFPEEEFLEAGYYSKYVGGRSGPSSPVGVAILSRRDWPEPLELVRGLPGVSGRESHFLAVEIGGVLISSVYVPQDPREGVPWLNRLSEHVCEEGYNCGNSVFCGDFNVRIVADHPGSDSPKAQQDALNRLMRLGFCDVYRIAHPDPGESPGHTRGWGQKYPSRLHLILASMSLVEERPRVWLDLESRPRKDAPPLVAVLGRGS